MSEKNPKKRSLSKEMIPDEEKTFQTFCKQMLQTRVFRGCYQERRYVELLNEYRDLIVIDKQEKQLIKDLTYLRNRIQNFYENKQTNEIGFNANSWIGITLPEMIGAPAAGVCIWTEIENITFGRHWFYINSMKFRNNEIIIKIRQLRSEDPDGNFSGRSTIGGQRNTNNSNTNEMNSPSDNDDINIQNSDNNFGTEFIELLSSWKNGAKKSIFDFLSNEINRDNIVATMKFLAIAIISLIAFSIEAVKYIGIYTLKFMIELRLWVYTCTPIIFKLIELITKLIGGFFILIAMIWKDTMGRDDSGQTARVFQYNMLTSGPADNPQLQYQQRYISGGEYYRNLHNGNNRNYNNRRR